MVKSQIQGLHSIDGNSEHDDQWENSFFMKNYFRYVTTLDLNKCFKHIKQSRSFHMGAPISKIPSNISTTTYFYIY